MSGLVAAELLKLRTTRLVYGLLAATVVLALIGVAASVATAGDFDQSFALDTDEGVRNVFSSAGAGSIFVLVLGILGMTSEFRHGTMTETFLVTPERGRVVLAKMVVYAGVGLVFAVVASVATVALALPRLAAEGVDVSLTDPDLARVLIGVVISTAIYGLLGVAVGALIRNSIAAVIVALAWTFVVEGLLIAVLPEVGKWLPGGAVSAVVGQSVPDGELLGPVVGGLVLVAYGIAFAVIGTRFVVRRDIT